MLLRAQPPNLQPADFFQPSTNSQAAFSGLHTLLPTAFAGPIKASTKTAKEPFQALSNSFLCFTSVSFVQPSWQAFSIS